MLRVKYKASSIKQARSSVREVANLREGQGDALGERRKDLALQRSVDKGEDTRMVEYSAYSTDSDLSLCFSAYNAEGIPRVT